MSSATGTAADTYDSTVDVPPELCKQQMKTAAAARRASEAAAETAARLERLRKRYRIDVAAVPEAQQQEVFGDYLRNIKRPRTALKTVRAQYEKAMWVPHTKMDHGFMLALSALGPVRSADLDASLSAFQQRETGSGCTAANYLSKQQLTHRMLRAAAHDIAKFLPIEFSQPVDHALPHMKRARLQLVDAKAAAKRERRRALERALEAEGVAQPLMSIMGIHVRLDRFEEHPEHPDFTPVKTAAAIADFVRTQDDEELRLSRVQAELKAWGTPYRSDSSLTRQYVEGNSDLDVQEVAAIMTVARFLFNDSHVCWSVNHHEMEAELKMNYLKGSRTWRQAYDYTRQHFKKAPIIPLDSIW